MSKHKGPRTSKLTKCLFSLIVFFYLLSSFSPDASLTTLQPNYSILYTSLETLYTTFTTASMSIDTAVFERLSSPAAIIAFIVISLALLYASVQDTLYDPIKSLVNILYRPKFSTEITSLRVYPVKSCRGIQVSSWKLLKSGLELDRNWMFVESDTKKFITIRQHSKMTLIDTALADGCLHLTIRGTDKRVSIPAPPSRAWLEQNCVLDSGIDIWDEQTDAWLYPESYSQHASELLGASVRLVYKGPKPRLNGAPELLGREQPHYFADMMSVLVGSESSLTELNGRLRENGHSELTIERFRPNIVVRGGTPWSEDSWKRIRICGDAADGQEHKVSFGLDVPNRCLRCQVPNVDPETGVKHKEQPWGVLTKYRKVDQKGKVPGKPVFGMLCIPTDEGQIKVGMRLELLETTENHAFMVTKWKDL